MKTLKHFLTSLFVLAGVLANFRESFTYAGGMLKYDEIRELLRISIEIGDEFITLWDSVKKGG